MSTSTDETYSGAGGQSDWGSEDSDSGVVSTRNDSDDSYSVSSSFSSSLTSSSSVSLGENRRKDCERCEKGCCGDCQPKSCILPNNRPPCCKAQCRPILKKGCCPCPKRMSCASSCAPALTYAQTLLLIKESQARLQSSQQQQCCSTCAPVVPVAPCAQPVTQRQQLPARAHCPVYSSQPLACPQPVPPAPQLCCSPAPQLVCCAPAPAPPAPKPCCGCIIRAN
jgi:hypothetical protein